MKLLIRLSFLSLVLFFVNCAVFTSVSEAVSSVSTALGSVSDSLESISDSLASSSESSADEEEARLERYRQDVRSLTAVVIEEKMSSGQFLSELDRLALSHGVTNWKAEKQTYFAIGEGIRMSGADEKQLSAISERISKQAYSHILKGYHSAGHL